MFIECAYKDTTVAINLDNVTTIAESIRTNGLTAITFWLGNDSYVEVNEAYESVMAKVRAAQ